jgi:cell division cycle 20-like protein 1 (cofactor of APC complex)
MDPDYEQRLLRQVNGPKTPTKNTNSPQSSPFGKGKGSPGGVGSPSKRGQEVSADRFIPSRAVVNLTRGFLSTPPQENSEPVSNSTSKEPCSNTENKESLLYTSLLRNELLREEIETLSEPCEDRQPLSTPVRCLFKNRISKRKFSPESLDAVSPYSVSPISSNSHKLLRSPKKAVRKISKVPFKVLDAPDLQDDFYLNLVDWSSQNILSVGLASCVYLWSAYTSQVCSIVVQILIVLIFKIKILQFFNYSIRKVSNKN